MSVFLVIAAVITTIKTNEELLNTAQKFEFLLYGLILVTCMKKLSIMALRALGDYKIFSTFELLPSLFMMVFVSIAIVLNVKDAYFIYFYYIPHFLLAILAFSLAIKQFKKNDAPKNQYPLNLMPSSGDQTKLPTYLEILTVSVPMLGVTLSQAVITNTDILMLSNFTNDKTVGIYSVYVKIGALMAITLSLIHI